MKILCACGEHVLDNTDNQSHKAHLLPEKALEPLFDALDALIEHHGRTASQREAACMQMRTLISQATRRTWQCRACGRLLVEDARHQVQFFLPDRAEPPTDLLDVS